MGVTGGAYTPCSPIAKAKSGCMGAIWSYALCAYTCDIHYAASDVWR